jgi:hypothetical protein
VAHVLHRSGPVRARHGYNGSDWRAPPISTTGNAATTATIRWQIPAPHYESSIDEGRRWVSFRDPFFFLDPQTGERLLLSAARVKTGPVIRRGCVGLAREVAPDRFEFEPPLYRPGLYDDVEVPNLFTLGGRYYLMGSIREDTKIHYWYADALEGPYHNFFDNVILPTGNYAGRVCGTDDGLLLFNFFSKPETVYGREEVKKLLPPPKRLVIRPRRAPEAQVQFRLRQARHRPAGRDRLLPVQIPLRQSACHGRRPARRPAPVLPERLRGVHPPRPARGLPTEGVSQAGRDSARPAWFCA